MHLRRGVARLVLACAMALSTRAHAETAEASTAERATAESLFADGKRLMSEGQIAQACRAFAESQRLDAGGGTLFALAFCHEQEKKTASAWLEFKEALAIARRDGRHDREVLALEHITALEPRLAHVTLRVKVHAPELTLRLDGAVVGEAAWGTAIPVDPGAHMLEAAAPGMRGWVRGLTIKETTDSLIDVPALEPLTADSMAMTRAIAEPAPSDRGHEQRVAAYVLGGAGVAMIGVGAIFGARAVMLKNRSDDGCDSSTCNAAGHADFEDARSAARVANIGFGVGLAALAGSVVVWLTAPSARVSDEPRPSSPAALGALRIAPSLTASGGGLVVGARF